MKPCCEENRGNPRVPDAEKPDLTVRTCEVCGANHYMLTLDPLDLNMTGADL